MANQDQLMQRCRNGETVCSGFLEWCGQYPKIVGQHSQAIRHSFNRYARQFERLEKAAERPMGVAVFGPSQAGKSYLISALARQGTKPLMARFGTELTDFVKDINPGGGKESTGIVTRFTVKDIQSPHPESPVVLRLLSELDIIKIITNSYFSDVQASAIPRLDTEQIEEALKQAETMASATFQGSLKHRDIYDFRNYLARYFRGIARLECFDDAIWMRLIELLPKLPIQPRSELLALFWGGHDAFTQLYRRLFEALQNLGFAEHAYCALETNSSVQGALLPRSESVIDVATLNDLGAEQSSTITTKSETGTTITLRRCDLAALIAELVIRMEDKPYDYFDYTDLLDFPGYRAREEIEDVDSFLVKKNGLPKFFLRGKVDFLYRRYREDRELTSMILCVAASNQDVNSLPEAVFEWISDTHGETPEQRFGKKTTLFLALTMFDKEFEEKQGMGEKDEDYVNQWETRLHASIWEFLGKQHDWVGNWDGNGPFNNTFWIRNPNYKAKHIFQYDENGSEVGIVESPRERKRIEKLRQGFLNNPNVTQHFKDATTAFDEALKPNEGGVNYLAKQLGGICDPNLKANQLHDQVNRLYAEIKDQISSYHVGDDHTEMVNKRVNGSKLTVRTLARCAEAQRFGNFLREIQITEDETTRIYYRLHREGPAHNAEADETADVSGGESFLAGVLDDIAPSTTNNEAASQRSVFAEAYADEVMSTWVSRLHDIASDPVTLGYYLLSSNVLLELIKELGAGAHRVKLKDEISEVVSATERKRLTVHDAVKLPARRSARIINDFVNFLAFDKLPLAERPQIQGRAVFSPQPAVQGLPTLQPAPQSFEIQYTRDWLKAFLEFVLLNVSHDPMGSGGDSDAGFFDPVANQTLGDILAKAS